MSLFVWLPSSNRAMLELDQILRANEINFAILAALPAFFLSFLLLMLMRAWLKKVKSMELLIFAECITISRTHMIFVILVLRIARIVLKISCVRIARPCLDEPPPMP